ncbi:MAG: HAMP domain-containing protein [Roseburia sp.]
MKKWMKYIVITLAIAAGIYAAVVSLRERTVSMDHFIAVSNGVDGDSIVAWYEGDETVVARVSNAGKIEKYVSFDTLNKGRMYTIRGIAAGSADTAYMLRDVRNAQTGNLIEQELVILDFGRLFPKEQKSFVLTDETENYEYQWIYVTGETITLIATDMYEEQAIRRTYEYGSLLADTLNIKNTRIYPLAKGEGIYQAMGNNTDLVYISDSGKIYRADEESVTEVYPARKLTTLMYPTFLAYAESGCVYFGEHESGNIVKLDLSNGDEEVVMAGGTSIGGAGVYTPKSFVQVSMTSLNVYTAVVCDTQNEKYNLLSSYDGRVTLIKNLKYSLAELGIKFAKSYVLAFLLCGGIILLIALFISGIRNGQTIMGRLVYVSIPLIVVVMSLFELISYQYYRSAIEENFEKQVEDEGNMLTALFGQDVFGEVEYPYDYSGDAYIYLSEQLKTRELYNRILYYESGEIYIGVDENSPCFYPVDIWMNQGAKELYEEAALTGKQVIGYIKDQMGERLVCITPVGGASGQTVYLMENGLYVSNIDSYMSGYTRNFTIICVSFSIMILVLLSIFFYRVLSPIQEMKWVMGRYVEGEQDVRVDVKSEDELAGIGRVFNKMAEDALVQTHNLEKMSKTYYRFMPASIMELLNKENLADLTLNSRITGEYVVVQAFIRRQTDWSLVDMEEATNRFFATLNQFATSNGLVAVMDDAAAGNIRLICRNGVESALNTALAVLAKVDADNASEGCKEKLQAFFLIHQSEINFCICGDEERYIPTLFAPEMDELLKNREFIEQMESRILLTRDAYELIQNKDVYANRYIGEVSLDTEKIGMYDMYDDRSAEAIRRIRHTANTFHKAMALYEKGFYYEAKNLFTLVLRENREDMAAKYYIFQCEKAQDES